MKALPKSVEPKLSAAPVVPVFISMAHLLDLLHPVITSEASFKRWWVDAHQLNLTENQPRLPQFIKVETARISLSAAQVHHSRRAETRLDALEQSLRLPLSRLPIITGMDFAATRDIEQIIRDLTTQQVFNVKLEERVKALESKVSQHLEVSELRIKRKFEQLERQLAQLLPDSSAESGSS